MDEAYVCDFSLFRVARQLRLLGCDVACDEDIRHQQVVLVAKQQDRVIITASKKFEPHLQAVQRVDQRNNPKDARFAVGEYHPLLRTSTEQDDTATVASAGAATAPAKSAHKGEDVCPTATATTPDPPPPVAAKEEPTAPRQRHLTGYNSEGESEYEYDDEEEGEVDEADRLIGGGGGDEPSAFAGGHDVAGGAGGCDDDDDDLSDDVPLRYILVNAFDPFKKQAETIVRRMGVQWDHMKVFSRCVQCNGVIDAVKDKQEVEDEVHSTVYRLYPNFYRCCRCRRVYWGMDNGVLVNYKALRTVEHAKAMCLRALATTDSDSTQQEACRGGHRRRGRLHRIGRGRGADQDEGADPASNQKNVPVAPGNLTSSGANNTPVPSCFNSWGNTPLAGLHPDSRSGLKIHLYAYPRNIKCTIISFLAPEDHEMFLGAYPVFAELVRVVTQGEAWNFRPAKRKKRNQLTGK